MKRVILFLFANLSFLFINNSFAAAENTSFTVMTTIEPICNITAMPMDFGTYNPLSDLPLDTETIIQAQCIDGSPYAIGLDLGRGAGASNNMRRMTSIEGDETIDYNLFKDNGYTQVWGSNFGKDTLEGKGNGSIQDIVIYGRIPAGQKKVLAAVYSDTITVTIKF